MKWGSRQDFRETLIQALVCQDRGQSWLNPGRIRDEIGRRSAERERVRTHPDLTKFGPKSAPSKKYMCFTRILVVRPSHRFPGLSPLCAGRKSGKNKNTDIPDFPKSCNLFSWHAQLFASRCPRGAGRPKNYTFRVKKYMLFDNPEFRFFSGFREILISPSTCRVGPEMCTCFPPPARPLGAGRSNNYMFRAKKTTRVREIRGFDCLSEILPMGTHAAEQWQKSRKTALWPRSKNMIS